MKFTKRSFTTIVLATLAAGALSSQAADVKPKPYPLAKCIVSGEAFEGSEMTPYQFVYEGQTIKLCCKGCLEDFNKEPAKYLKKLEKAGK
jgi:YHS domain-containing protein